MLHYRTGRKAGRVTNHIPPISRRAQYISRTDATCRQAGRKTRQHTHLHTDSHVVWKYSSQTEAKKEIKNTTKSKIVLFLFRVISACTLASSFKVFENSNSVLLSYFL
jgi:hypothetical protein